MSTFFSRLSRSASRNVAVSVALFAGSVVNAETVTLRSVDGDFALTGKISALVDGDYLIDGPLGALRVDPDRVICEGAACPRPDLALASVSATKPTTMPVEESPAQSVTEAAGLTPATALDEAVTADLGFTLLDGFLAQNDGIGSPKHLPEVGFGLTLAEGDLTLSTGLKSFESLSSGKADLALVIGVLPPADLLDKDRVDVLTHDAVVLVAHPTNPVDQLTLEEIRAIYTGQITNWSEVSGPDTPIRVIVANDVDANEDVISRAIFAEKDAERAPMLESLPTVEALQVVADDPLAIAFVRQSSARDLKPVQVVDQCGFRASPDAMSLDTGAYPMDVPVYLISRAVETKPSAEAFVAYATSRTSDQIYAEAGLADRAIQRMSLDDRIAGIPVIEGTGRTADLAQELRDAAVKHERLTVAVPFAFSSTSVDAAAAADIDRLVEYLAGLPAGTRIQVSGFSDDLGTAQSNRAVSIERARTVAAALVARAQGKLDSITISSMGYSDLMPIHCNDSTTGRAINRRVEIWINLEAETAADDGATPGRTNGS